MKKVLATLLASAMALSAVAGLTACGGDNGKTITVWAPEAAIPAYRTRVEDWKADNEEYKDWTVNFVNKAEGEAETDLGIDPAAGADIVFFEAGQIATMKSKLYLQTLTKEYTDLIKARDTATTYEPIMDGDYALAFPCTSDNGYFMYYDKTFFEEDDVTSLDKMLAKMEGKTVDVNGTKQQVQIMMEYDNGYYEVTWFFGTGCTMDYLDEDQTQYFTDVASTEAGRTAARASIKYLGDNAQYFQTGGTGALLAGFANGSVVAALSGTWGAQGDESGSLKSYLAEAGRSYDQVVGAVKLPTFTSTLDDGTEKTYQMGSFTGGKYCGVNRYKNNVETITASMSLANYFCDERGQTLRFEQTEAGPSNIAVAATDAVKNNMLISALNSQNAAGGYAQLSQSGLWDAMAAFGKACYTKDADQITLTNMQQKLDDLAKAMAGSATLVDKK